MKMPSNLGMLLLAIFLIVYGAIGVLSLSFANKEVILGIVAIAAGILLLLGK
jgi:hypothetical protein